MEYKIVYTRINIELAGHLLRAVVVSRPGPPEVLEICDIALPRVGPGPNAINRG